MNLRTIFMHTIWKGLDRHAAKLAACRYIPKHFQPSKKRNVRSVYSLKHEFERAETRYINEDDYTECLRRCGFKVVNGKVYAKEVDAMRS